MKEAFWQAGNSPEFWKRLYASVISSQGTMESFEQLQPLELVLYRGPDISIKLVPMIRLINR